jgi:hypothetical protein
MGAFGYNLSCYSVSALTLAILKDPSQSEAAKVAAFSFNFFALLMISEATCYSLDVGYLDLAKLATCGAMALPVAVLVSSLARFSSFQRSALS